MFALLILGVELTLLYGVAVGIYRLYLSPLSKVPGPSLAALFSSYEVYYDLVKHGQFPWKTACLHQQYGSIVRIGPNEVHINDPEFVPVFFSSSNTAQRDKYAPYRQQLGIPNSLTSTIDTFTHGIRRNALAPFLSSPKVSSYTDLILSKIEKVSLRFESAKQSGEVVELRSLFWHMTTDIITAIAFPIQTSFLDNVSLGQSWYAFHKGGQGKLLWFKHFPFLWTLLHSIPPKWLLVLVPQAKGAMDWEKSNKDMVQEILADVSEEGKRGKTVFHHLLRSDLPPSEKRSSRIWQEATSLVGAGVETISNTLCVTLFHLIQNPNILHTLTRELEIAIPDPHSIPPINTLTALPYLSAVIEEGLRKALGVVSRFIRVAPSDTIVYGSYILPPGTAISISTLLIHNDPNIFPEPEKFIPDRWLNGKVDRKFMIAFGGGTRKCIGVHLAHAELYLTIAVLLRRYRFESFETGYADVDAKNDSVLPLPERGSKGVRVLVK